MDRRGFTLFEVVLYIGISSTILLAAAAMFTYATTSRAKAQSIEEVEKQGDIVARRITQVVRNGYGIRWPRYQETDSRLAVGSYTQATDPIEFRVTNGRVTMQEGPSATALDLTTSEVSVTSMSVTNTSALGAPGSVDITLVLQANGGGTFAYQYQKTFRFTAAVRQP